MALRKPIKPASTGRHVGFGKVIFFGEHLVVHGETAIVAGVAEYTSCELKITPGKPGLHVIDDRPAVPGYKKEKRAEQIEAHKLVLQHLQVDYETRDGIEIRLAGPLVPSSGIGASASDVVSLSRALSEVYGLNLSEKEVNQSAFVGEGGYHGTPSGVDNTAATFGGLLQYKRTPQGPHFGRIQLSVPLYIVVVSTGITSSTTKVVADVTNLKKADPKRWQAWTKRYQTILARALAGFASGKLTEVAGAMNDNHTLCQELTISCPELDGIVHAARAFGALGAKMSGTGRGGIALALCRDKASQSSVAASLKEKCPYAKFIWPYTVSPTSAGAKL